MALGHGKVILLGEHSVVHGRPALAMAVPRGADVTGEVVRGADRTTLHIEPWGVRVDSGAEPNEGRERLQEALRVARRFYDDAVEVALSAQVSLPSGAGMGSSAALGVAVLRALDEARGLSRPDQELFERSLAWERVFHGNPSGVDNAMATHGGIALFRRGEGIRPVVPRVMPRLIVGNSGESSDTKIMVDSVARQYQREPERIGKLFDAIATLVQCARDAIVDGNMRTLGQLMIANHKLLAFLMLSTDTLERMNERALEAGALGAKVTGAGGGGCMIALVDSDESAQAVSAALRDLGKDVYEVRSGDE